MVLWNEGITVDVLRTDKKQTFPTICRTTRALISGGNVEAVNSEQTRMKSDSILKDIMGKITIKIGRTSGNALRAIV